MPPDPRYVILTAMFASEGAGVSLHGGPIGFDSLPWTLLTPENPAALFTQAELAHLSSPNTAYAIFRLTSPNGDQGFPGKLVIEALVAVIGPGEQERKYRTASDARAASPEYDLGSIVLAYRAKLDEEGKKVVTPVNLTQVHFIFISIMCGCIVCVDIILSTGASTWRRVCARLLMWRP